MAAGTVVVNFNIFEHGVAHLFTGGKVFAMDDFNLHGSMAAFPPEWTAATLSSLRQYPNARC